MTEPTEGAVTAPENGTENAGRRGRPRPEATKERDELVLQHLGPDQLTRAELMMRLESAGAGLNKNQTYLSLWRLRRDGRVTRERSGADHKWKQTAPAAPTG